MAAGLEIDSAVPRFTYTNDAIRGSGFALGMEGATGLVKLQADANT